MIQRKFIDTHFLTSVDIDLSPVGKLMRGFRGGLGARTSLRFVRGGVLGGYLMGRRGVLRLFLS